MSDLLQTEWFGRTNSKDTKAYQHTSREKRALMLREDIKKGLVGGQLAEQIKVVPVEVKDAILKARIQAVHDVGTGICIHNFSQTPCERHLQCLADCKDYVWAKDDKRRLDEQTRQYALALLARQTAEKQLNTEKPKKSADWLAHNDKKLKTLSTQLADNGVEQFTPSNIYARWRMAKRFSRMSGSDINTIVADLDRWALGELGSKLTWAVLEECFSRQSLQAKAEIKAAYDSAKRALSGGLVKTREQATKEAQELQVEVDRLEAELEAYRRKEEQWLRRWQQIAFHARQKGIQMVSVDKAPPEGAELPPNSETAQILRPFDKDIPPSGRI